MKDIAINVENLGKRYRIGEEQQRHDTLFGTAKSWVKSPIENFRRLRRLNRFDEHERSEDIIWALEDVSFEVERGEVLGVIGRNGAGKSTLLKILSRITEPTTGRVELRGRVSSLLEVGTGFHSELTGRENVYLNGTVLGMSKSEVDKKFDEIVAFSGIEKFIDTPVKRYSSGMQVRLAFAVAAHLEPEILLIDEVLAVGDFAFQKRCLGKMDEVANSGRTVLFVSHQMDMIRSLCERVILLEHGGLKKTGDADQVIETYTEPHKPDNSLAPTSFDADVDPALPIQILHGEILGSDQERRAVFDVFEPVTIVLDYVIRQPLEGGVVNFELMTRGSTLLVSFDTDRSPELLQERSPGRYRTKTQIPAELLKPGNYSITTNVGIANTHNMQRLEDALKFDVELVSEPSSLKSFASKRDGRIISNWQWQTTRVSDDTDAY